MTTANETKPVTGELVEESNQAKAQRQEIQAREQKSTALSPATQQATQVLSMLERVLTAPEFDIDRAERLWAMQKEVMDKQAERAYIEANSLMQGNLPSVVKRGEIKNSAGNVQSTYALWEDVNEAIKPVLMKHGFAISFRVEQEGNKITVTAVLSHKDGHSTTTWIELAPDTTGSKNAVQAVGSAISYGKRYTAGALLNLTSHNEDDDGRAFGDPDKTDEVMAKVADFEAAIMGAVDETELQKVGADIASSGLPPRLRTRVRHTFTARLRQIRNPETQAAES